jgi:hypothetical protein
MLGLGQEHGHGLEFLDLKAVRKMCKLSQSWIVDVDELRSRQRYTSTWDVNVYEFRFVKAETSFKDVFGQPVRLRQRLKKGS